MRNTNSRIITFLVVLTFAVPTPALSATWGGGVKMTKDDNCEKIYKGKKKSEDLSEMDMADAAPVVGESKLSTQIRQLRSQSDNLTGEIWELEEKIIDLRAEGTPKSKALGEKLETQAKKLRQKREKIDRAMEKLKEKEGKSKDLSELDMADAAPVSNESKISARISQLDAESEELLDKVWDLDGKARRLHEEGTPESNALGEKLENQAKKLRQQRDRIDAEIEKLKEEKAKSKLLTVEAKAKKDKEFGMHLNDSLVAEQLKSLKREKTVTLIVGNPFTNTPPKVRDEFLKLASVLSSRGYTVVYDADTKMAPALGKVLGKNGIGISSQSSKAKEPGIVTLSNDYLRLERFAKAKTVLISPDSVTGAGLLVHDAGDLIVLDPSKGWQNPLLEWERSVKDHLGLNFQPTNQVASAAELLERRPYDAVTPQKLPNFGKTKLSSYDTFDLEIAIDHAELMVAANKAMTGPAGSVFFGSSKPDSRWLKKVTDSAETVGKLGVPVTTGGSGGYMEAANRGAYKAGVESVGIPLGGFSSLSSEKKVAKGVQTQTISATGYESRIPLLLKDRPLVVVVPGGSGTMKEVATTFVSMAAQPNLPRKVVFLDKTYYKALTEWLLKSGLPKEFKDKIILSDQPAELGKVVTGMLKDPNFKVKDIKQPKAPTPRALPKIVEKKKTWIPKAYDEPKEYEGGGDSTPEGYWKW